MQILPQIITLVKVISKVTVVEFHHVHFFVDNADSWAQWFEQRCGFQCLGRTLLADCYQVWLQQGAILFRLSSPLTDTSAVAQYLTAHSAGIADVGFAVKTLEAQLQRLLAAGGTLLQPISQQLLPYPHRACQVGGWGTLSHTLVELPPKAPQAEPRQQQPTYVEAIDHVVLNVPQGELTAAVSWYERIFGFQKEQRFEIHTPYSGLRSQVLSHPQGNALLPINEPTTANSQIQEYLNYHRGAGIQHMALRTENLVDAIATFRRQGLKLLSVPMTYFEELRHRPGYFQTKVDWPGIARQQILADWSPENPQAMLLQTFTKPLFSVPTFFLELIERQRYWHQGQLLPTTGFGEGNFQALFEALEREQQQRRGESTSLLP